MTFQHAPDPPWIFRTYAGHSTPAESNKLYRANLAKGQTGLSVAFDLPTQTGYDSDHILARGEVGKVGVPIGHLGDMRALFDQIPLDQMNTSMTINAPAAWLLALYVSLAEEQGADPRKLTGTTQNDILKEYLSRGTYIFPPAPSLKLTADTIAWSLDAIPKWNAMNVCSYHLQEAGATPEQELAFALAAAIAVLDEVKARGEIAPERFGLIFSRMSFFVNAGMRFVTELCKMRAFTALWEEIGRDRYGVTDEKALRFRYGVQVNSLGLTEQQAENNVYRILLETLAVTLSKNARARAVQLPAWNEALGLPRPWDQQWSLRMQQVLAYETDLLEFEDLFDGSKVVEAKVAQLIEGARAELAKLEASGGAVANVDYMKGALVDSNRRRIEGIERGGQKVIGVNAFTEGEPSPLEAGEKNIQTVDLAVEGEQIARLKAWRSNRDGAAVEAALAALHAAAQEDKNIMPASIAAAKAGVTTGEWAATLRKVYGEYRGPTGVAVVIDSSGEDIDAVKQDVAALSDKLGRTLTFLVGKPGLDGHSNGAEQIAARARAVGMDAIYEGIRLTPAEIVKAAKEKKAHAVGLSILSGSHLDLVQEVVRLMRAEGLDNVPLIVGGIIPPADALALRQMGVAGVYTPKDFRITQIMGDVVKLVAAKTSA
ncbi:MAG: methylmalonyl-CoA mutase family protein [Hyphomonadaceae bacterium JAD_PAG50586_4]|nr:MAG: methylmalonyl-CoA mutase family protein [Hyphomonadaceae bacterium JAD_PAG50586_4]